VPVEALHVSSRIESFCWSAPRSRKKVEQAVAVTARDRMPGKFLAARTVDRYNPFRLAQFEQSEQRGIIRWGAGRNNGRGGDGLYLVASMLVWKLSLPSPGRRPPAWDLSFWHASWQAFRIRLHGRSLLGPRMDVAISRTAAVAGGQNGSGVTGVNRAELLQRLHTSKLLHRPLSSPKMNRYLRPALCRRAPS
jgi:hypothetical protein